jgi:hypothetical protein
VPYHFAADVDPVKAKVMFAVQQPLHWSALGEVMGVPAWKALPTWFLIADGDQAIPPDAQRQFAPRMGATTIEVPTNHVAMVSHPDEVVNLITTAALRTLADALDREQRSAPSPTPPRLNLRRVGRRRAGGPVGPDLAYEGQRPGRGQTPQPHVVTIRTTGALAEQETGLA